MKISVTNHAVDRYLQRVDGAKGFYPESVREQIRRLVEDGFKEGAVRPHPTDKKKRVIPFRSGDSTLFLSIGPDTTGREGDLSVISVLFEHEGTPGKVGLGLTIGDLFPEQPFQHLEARKKDPRYVLFVGERLATEDAREWHETYWCKDEAELRRIIDTRKPHVDEVAIYQLIE